MNIYYIYVLHVRVACLGTRYVFSWWKYNVICLPVTSHTSTMVRNCLSLSIVSCTPSIMCISVYWEACPAVGHWGTGTCFHSSGLVSVHVLQHFA